MGEDATACGPLWVIADYYRMACDYAHNHELGREGTHWRLLREFYQVLGRPPGRFVRVTAGKAPGPVLAEHDAIVSALHMRGWTEVPHG